MIRSLISGIVGLAWGLFILISFVRRGGPQGEGAYLFGQYIGLGLGILMVLGGAYYLYDSLMSSSYSSTKKSRKRKKKKDAATIREFD